MPAQTQPRADNPISTRINSEAASRIAFTGVDFWPSTTPYGHNIFLGLAILDRHLYFRSVLLQGAEARRATAAADLEKAGQRRTRILESLADHERSPRRKQS